MLIAESPLKTNYKKSDITGQRFGRLVALRPTAMRDSRGYVIWHCRCDCGNEVDVAYNSLVYCNQKSCGCKKREHEMTVRKYLEHTNGTSIAMLKSTKMYTSNTTGYRGVYFVNGKYLAKIVFQKKQYYLGKYDTAKEASEVRKEAEKLLFTGFSEYYKKWKKLANANPKWGEENPVQLSVLKNDLEFRLQLTPELTTEIMPYGLS